VEYNERVDLTGLLVKSRPPNMPSSAVAEYTDHYYRERNHQGIGNRLICAPAAPESSGRQVRRRAGSVDC
jgi:hypothetical protein